MDGSTVLVFLKVTYQLIVDEMKQNVLIYLLPRRAVLVEMSWMNYARAFRHINSTLNYTQHYLFRFVFLVILTMMSIIHSMGAINTGRLVDCNIHAVAFAA